MIKKIILAVLLCQFTFAQEILNLKDRATLIEKIQKDRLDNLLPELMSKNGIDMWIIITREYNEDPIIKTLLPPTWLNARRRTILVFSFDESTKKNIQELLNQQYGSKLNLEFNINKSLLGGMTVVIGSKMIDLSIANQVSKFTNNVKGDI